VNKKRFAAKILKRPIKTTSEILRIAALCHKTTPFRSADFSRALSRALHLCYEQNYLPKEAFELGLFNPNLPAEELSNYISRKALTKLQKALNPESWAPLLKDKGIFYKYCTAAGIPVPKLYAVFFRTTAGWAFDGSVLVSRDSWERFFNLKIPSEFVIKPSQGAFGERVNIFTKTGKDFTDAFAKQYKAADLYEMMLSDHKYDSFIIQERIRNHPELIRFTGTEFLQTVRVITSIDACGRSCILHARLKVILGQAVVDNWQHGFAGNAKCHISLSDGFLISAITMDPDSLEIKTVSAHPKTNIPFDQCRLPLWPEARTLVEKTAIKLLPVRTIGWDVALTPNGPLILEGNIWWDPPNQNPRIKIISQALHHDSQLLRDRKAYVLKHRLQSQTTKRMNKMRLAADMFEQQVREFFRIVRFCHTAASFHSPDYFKVLLRALRLWRKEEFLPKEAFQFGLFKPDLSNTELSKCISRAKLTKIQLSINPASWAPLVKNKGVFYRYCMDLGVPVPKLYAIFFRENAGWSSTGSVPATRDDWEKLLTLQLPSEFVSKPSEGSLGRGVNVFTRTDKGFINASGKQYNAADIYDNMLSDPKYDSFLFQERLKNHPELIRLTDTQFLQTVRVITYIDTAGCCRIIHANLKLILGQTPVDNWQRGLTGNATAVASLSDGLLEPAIAIPQNSSEIRTIPTHPKTGIPFDRFRLPLWPQMCSLVKETAIKFLPVRTIGWDVALTPNGPVILEGNIWWDAPNQHRRLDVILEALSDKSKDSQTGI
jgi:glutathione synthase/RimK-type ligase-like ATP-grasp enzyme